MEIENLDKKKLKHCRKPEFMNNNLSIYKRFSFSFVSFFLNTSKVISQRLLIFLF